MRRTTTLLVGLSVAFSLVVSAAIAEDDEAIAEWIAQVRAATSKRNHREVIRLTDEMIRQHPEVKAELRPLFVFLFAMRGDAHLLSGDAATAVADYDRQIELEPAARDPHWQRGIAYYYAGKYAEGEQQFAWYQNHDAEDVENVVFHFACRARRLGLESARQAIFDRPRDRRVPMSEIYDFYLGKATVEQVLEAAEAGDPTEAQLNSRLMYANLYLALYYDATGSLELAEKHIKAADRHRVDTYMWDVAHLHAEQFRKEASK